jgi:phage terminase large subunit GpA-like protein
LRLERPTDEELVAGIGYPPGYIHLPRGADAEWLQQLVAEQLVTVTTRRGFQKLEWQKLRDRKEVLDCRVYARAAAWIAGADRWNESVWTSLEEQCGAKEPSSRPLDPQSRPRTSEFTVRSSHRRDPREPWIGRSRRRWLD